MPYVKAVTLAVVAAIALGAGVGAVERLRTPTLSLENTATAYSQSISEAIYCAVFFMVVLVPTAVLVVFSRLRWGRRQRGERR